MFSVSNLSCSKGDKQLFSGVSFTLQPGQWLHLEGDNGVGKTSLLRLACGLSALEDGEITWNHQAVVQNPEAFRADLAYLGHQLALKEDLTPLENLRADAAVARFVRFTLTATVAWLAGRVLRHLPEASRLRLHLYCWLIFYSCYFVVMG